jgi:hypothetical protein
MTRTGVVAARRCKFGSADIRQLARICEFDSADMWQPARIYEFGSVQ